MTIKIPPHKGWETAEDDEKKIIKHSLLLQKNTELKMRLYVLAPLISEFKQLLLLQGLT